VGAPALACRVGLERVTLINDLEAAAYGVAGLGPQDLVTLNPGKPDPRGIWAGSAPPS
jgi:glucokinase